jgi:hypothetical protein
MSKIRGQVHTHQMRDTRNRRGGPCFFVYTGDGPGSQPSYPHVTVMLDNVLHEKAGLLFFRSSTFHVSFSDDHKLFYSVNRAGRFEVDGGQTGTMRLAELKAMGTTFINILRSDITAGISPDDLEGGWEGLRRPDRLRPWEWEALQRQNLLNDQARLRQLALAQNEAWARQFEWPDDT